MLRLFFNNRLAWTLLAFLLLEPLWCEPLIKLALASEERSPSPALSASTPTVSVAPAPEDYGVTVISENAPYKIRRSDMAGEWYGLDSSQTMLVTLRVGDEGQPAHLTITQRTGSSVATKIYDCKDVLVESGQFSLGARGSAVQLTGNAEATWGGATGVGRGMLIINGPEGQQRTELYFFKARERSWLDDMLAFARQYGLL